MIMDLPTNRSHVSVDSISRSSGTEIPENPDENGKRAFVISAHGGEGYARDELDDLSHLLRRGGGTASQYVLLNGLKSVLSDSSSSESAHLEHDAPLGTTANPHGLSDQDSFAIDRALDSAEKLNIIVEDLPTHRQPVPTALTTHKKLDPSEGDGSEDWDILCKAWEPRIVGSYHTSNESYSSRSNHANDSTRDSRLFTYSNSSAETRGDHKTNSVDPPSSFMKLDEETELPKIERPRDWERRCQEDRNRSNHRQGDSPSEEHLTSFPRSPIATAQRITPHNMSSGPYMTFSSSPTRFISPDFNDVNHPTACPSKATHDAPLSVKPSDFSFIAVPPSQSTPSDASISPDSVDDTANGVPAGNLTNEDLSDSEEEWEELRSSSSDSDDPTKTPVETSRWGSGTGSSGEFEDISLCRSL